MASYGISNRALAERARRGVERDHVSDALVPPIVERTLRSPGRPLPPHSRAAVECRVGADLADVRVHDDTTARRSAVTLGARAYAYGSHVVVGPGESVHDPRLLGHEAAHVLDQRLRGRRAVQRQATPQGAHPAGPAMLPPVGRTTPTWTGETPWGFGVLRRPLTLEEQVQLTGRLQALARSGNVEDLRRELDAASYGVRSGPEAYLALLRPGKAALRGEQAAAQALIPLLDHIDRYINTPMPSYGPAKQALLVALAAIAAGRIAEIDRALVQEAETLLVAGHHETTVQEIRMATRVFRRLRQVAAEVPGERYTSDEDIRETRADWARRTRTLLSTLQSRTDRTDPVDEQLDRVREYLGDYADYEEQRGELPWYMWVPILNIPGLFFWETSQQAFGEVGSALIFGPIVIPVLAAYNIALNPHNVVAITQGKVEVVQAIADPSLSDGERWDRILEFGGGQVTDLVFAKIGQRLRPFSSTPAQLGLRNWIVANRDALLMRVYLDALKSATGDTLRDLTSEVSPEEALANMGREVVKSAIANVLNANVSELAGDSETLEWVYQVVIEHTAGASSERVVPAQNLSERDGAP